MNIILEKAYIILWIIIPVILIFGLINSEKTIDVNIIKEIMELLKTRIK